MFRTTIAITLTLLSLSGTTPANAAVRSFFSPAVLGDRIAFCTSGRKDCGKVVADAWCTQNGFEEAILFQRDRSATPAGGLFIRYTDNGEICTGNDCISFAQIKCYSK